MCVCVCLSVYILCVHIIMCVYVHCVSVCVCISVGVYVYNAVDCNTTCVHIYYIRTLQVPVEETESV